MSKLTKNQSAALDALSMLSSQYRNDGWVDLPTLADRVRTSTEGLGYTLGSLVRRGMVERYKIAGRMQYRPTGREIVLPPRPRSRSARFQPGVG